MASDPATPGHPVGLPAAPPWLPTFVRGALAFLLLWAAVSKLGHPTSFLGSLYAYDLPLPRGLLKVVAVTLPWVELLCGLLLLARVWTESALLLLGALMSIFLLATGQAWARGLQISCGCFDFSLFGVDAAHAGWVKFIESPGFAFVRNLALLTAIAYLFAQTRAAAMGQLVQPPLSASHETRGHARERGADHATPQPAALPEAQPRLTGAERLRKEPGASQPQRR